MADQIAPNITQMKEHAKGALAPPAVAWLSFETELTRSC
jgi:hypothetical protein